MIVPAPGSEGLAVLRDAFPASFRRFSAVLEKITCPKPLLSNRLNRRPKFFRRIVAGAGRLPYTDRNSSYNLFRPQASSRKRTMKASLQRLWRQWFRPRCVRPFHDRLPASANVTGRAGYARITAGGGPAVMPLAAGSQVPYSIVNTAASPPPAAAPASVPAAPSAAPSSAPAAPQIVSTTNAAPATTTVVTPPYANPALTGETLFAPVDASADSGASPALPKTSAAPPPSQFLATSDAERQRCGRPASRSRTDQRFQFAESGSTTAVGRYNARRVAYFPASPTPLESPVVAANTVSDDAAASPAAVVSSTSAAVSATTASTSSSSSTQPTTAVLTTTSTTTAAPTTVAATPTAGSSNFLPIIAIGSDVGSEPWVKVYNATTDQMEFQFLAYDASFRGGVRVASADLNGDGVPDIITAPGAGMAPEIKVFDGKTGVQLSGPLGEFLAYNSSMQSGVFVAAGDVASGDVNDIIVAPGAGGGSQVRVFSGQDASLVGSFNAYGPGYEAGVPIAVGYWAGVNRDYVVTGTGPGALAEVRVFDAVSGQQIPGPIGDLHPYGQNFYGGVWVATGDTNGDGTSDVITGAGLGHTPEVKVFNGQGGSVLQDFLAGDASDRTGVRVAATCIASESHEDIVTAAGPGNAPQVNVYSGTTGRLLSPPESGFLAFDKSQRDGLFVAAAVDPSITATITLSTQEILVGGSVEATIAWSASSPAPYESAGSEVAWEPGSGVEGFYDGTLSGSWNGSHTYTTAGSYFIDFEIGITGPAGSAFFGNGVTLNVSPPPKPIVNNNTCTCTCFGGALIAGTPDEVGNPPAMVSTAPVRFADGVIQLGTADLTSDGFGLPWGQARSWSNGPGYAAGGDNGNGWVDTERLRLIQYDGSTNDTLGVIINGTTCEYFDLVSGAYQSRYFSQDTLVYNAAAQEFAFTDTSGDQIHFADFTVTPAAEQGAFKSFVDPYGNTTAVTSWTALGQIAEVQRSTVSGGNTITESYLYTYLTTGLNAGLLSNVTLRYQTNGGAWSAVRQVQYTYYDGTTSYGNQGDLELRKSKTAPATCWTFRTTATTPRPTPVPSATSAD